MLNIWAYEFTFAKFFGKTFLRLKLYLHHDETHAKCKWTSPLVWNSYNFTDVKFEGIIILTKVIYYAI